MSFGRALKLWVLLAFSLFLGDTQTKESVAHTSTVTLHVVDEFGEPIECKVRSFDDLHGSQLAGHFIDLRGRDIPRGLYTYTLDRVGSSGEISGSIQVNTPEQFVLIATDRSSHRVNAVAEDFGPWTITRGMIIPYAHDSKELMWVKLVSMTSDQQVSAAVDASGGFRLYGHLHGLFMMIVMRGAVVLHTQPVLFEQESFAPLVIHLQTEKPAAVRFPVWSKN